MKGNHSGVDLPDSENSVTGSLVRKCVSAQRQRSDRNWISLKASTKEGSWARFLANISSSGLINLTLQNNSNK